jgi:hypothetical protein
MWRIGLLVAVTVVEVVIGLRVVRSFSGVTGDGPFPAWVWPTMAIALLTVFWLWFAQRYVRRPLLFAHHYGALDTEDDSSALTNSQVAEGWFEDPYRLHQYRWFSKGKPSKLVRDGQIETEDAPPDMPYVGALVREASDTARNAGGADLRRATDGRSRDFWEAAADASTQFPLN